MRRKHKKSKSVRREERFFLLSAMQAVLALCVSAVFFTSAVILKNDEIKEELYRLVRNEEVPGNIKLFTVPDDILGRGRFSFEGKEPVPMAFNITSPFGRRVNPVLEKEEFHKGIDIKAPPGEKVGAVFPGKCEKTGKNNIDGNYVLMSHGNFKTKYCHLSRVLAEENMNLRAGETLGLAGMTGLATGSHLHLEIIKDGGYIDPACAFSRLQYEI